VAKWRKHMTLSQRNRYNEYSRFKYLRKRIESGNVPQPRNDMTPKIIELYRENGLSDVIFYPMSWMSDEIKNELRQDRRRLYDYIRDLLPAEYPTRKCKEIAKMFAKGEVTTEQIKRIT